MQVYEFMVPTHSNGGIPFDHTEFNGWLADRFGGYTKLAPAVGYWRDENTRRVFEESVIPYRVASVAANAGDRIGERIASMFGQLAVYVGRIGTAEILDYSKR